jgi:hypothetical protein
MPAGELAEIAARGKPFRGQKIVVFGRDRDGTISRALEQNSAEPGKRGQENFSKREYNNYNCRYN